MMERFKRLRGSNTLKSSTKDYFQIPTVEEDEEIHRIINCKNYFEVLEVSPNQDLDKEEGFLTDSYLQKCLLLSPNQCAHPKLEEAYEKLQTAYDTLSDSEARGEHRRMHFGLNEEERREEEQRGRLANLFGGGLFGRTLMNLPSNGSQQIIIHQGGNETDPFSDFNRFITLLGGNSVHVRLPQQAAPRQTAPSSRTRSSSDLSYHEEDEEDRVMVSSPTRRTQREVEGEADDSPLSRNPLLARFMRSLFDPASNAARATGSRDVSTPQENTNARQQMLEQHRRDARERRANRNRQAASSTAIASSPQATVTNREAGETRPTTPPVARANRADTNDDMFFNIFQRLFNLPEANVPGADEDFADGNNRVLGSGRRRSSSLRAQSNRRRSRTRAEATSQRERYAEQLRTLADMGFTDVALNIQVLNLVGGGLEEAIALLLSRH